MKRQQPFLSTHNERGYLLSIRGNMGNQTFQLKVLFWGFMGPFIKVTTSFLIAFHDCAYLADCHFWRIHYRMHTSRSPSFNKWIIEEPLIILYNKDVQVNTFLWLIIVSSHCKTLKNKQRIFAQQWIIKKYLQCKLNLKLLSGGRLLFVLYKHEKQINKLCHARNLGNESKPAQLDGLMQDPYRGEEKQGFLLQD